MALSQDFCELLSALNCARVRYLIVGGYAVGAHGQPRFTKDFDIWVDPVPDNAVLVYKVLKSFGAPLRGIGPETFTNPDKWYQMGQPPFRIDILMGVSGLTFDAAWKKRVTKTYGGVKAYFPSLEDLIRTKKASGRPRDLLDVAELKKKLKRRKKRRSTRP